MAWLHSSFMRCQAHEGSGGNFRKVASTDKDKDPDKSDTPLLHEMSSKADEKNSNYNWSKNISLNSKCCTFTKDSSCAASSNKCSSNMKPKNKEAGQNKKTTEDKKLLNLKKKNMEYEEKEYDSEDEWGFSSNSGYQKVSSNVD